jgi:hypothetical protein
MLIENFYSFLFEKQTGTSKPNEKTWEKWKSYANMTPAEINKFLNSENGKDAGLSKKEGQKAGIHTGKQSIKWQIKILQKNIKSFEEAKEKLSGKEWYWVNRMVSFNSRMSGAGSRIKGNKYYQTDSKGEVKKYDNGEPKMTRWLKSLMVWAYDPRK